MFAEANEAPVTKQEADFHVYHSSLRLSLSLSKLFSLCNVTWNVINM